MSLISYAGEKDICTNKSVSGSLIVRVSSDIYLYLSCGHSSLFSLADHLTVSTHLSTPMENGHQGMQAFNSTAIQEPPIDNHHCYWNVNGEGECCAPATPTPFSNRNRVMSDPVYENGSVPPARRHTACTSTTHSIRSTPQTSRSKVPSPARYQLTHKPLPTPPEEGGPDYTDPDGPPTLKAAHSYDKLDRCMSRPCNNVCPIHCSFTCTNERVKPRGVWERARIYCNLLSIV